MMGNYHVQFGKGSHASGDRYGSWFLVHIRLELAGPGVQYIAGALFNYMFKFAVIVRNSYSCCCLNQLTNPNWKQSRGPEHVSKSWVELRVSHVLNL
jgi:hypothetical protein